MTPLQEALRLADKAVDNGQDRVFLPDDLWNATLGGLKVTAEYKVLQHNEIADEGYQNFLLRGIAAIPESADRPPSVDYPISWFLKRIERAMRVAQTTEDGSLKWKQAADRTAREILSEVQDWL